MDILRAGETHVGFTVAATGSRVAVHIRNGSDVMHTFLAPAQARELAATILGTAELVERREGESGAARRDAVISLPTIRYNLPAAGRE